MPSQEAPHHTRTNIKTSIHNIKLPSSAVEEKRTELQGTLKKRQQEQHSEHRTQYKTQQNRTHKQMNTKKAAYIK